MLPTKPISSLMTDRAVWNRVRPESFFSLLFYLSWLRMPTLMAEERYRTPFLSDDQSREWDSLDIDTPTSFSDRLPIFFSPSSVTQSDDKSTYKTIRWKVSSTVCFIHLHMKLLNISPNVLLKTKKNHKTIILLKPYSLEFIHSFIPQVTYYCIIVFYIHKLKNKYILMLFEW